MKKTLSVIFILAIVFSACKRGDYAAQIELERKTIKQYIADKGITLHRFANGSFSDGVKKEDVCRSVTAPNCYYSLGEDSIYIRINEVDTLKPSVKMFDRVAVRYIETSLLDGTCTEYWTTLDLPYPFEVFFGDIPAEGRATNSNCAGWQSAIAMMKYSETVAEIIVPSKLGTAQNYKFVTPCHYKFYFQIITK